MKKTFYLVLSIISVVYIILVAVYGIHDITPFLPEFFNNVFFEYIIRYGAVVLIALFAFVNFLGNPLKLIFMFLLIAGVALYVLVFGFPSIFAGI